jgi:hypothetical protein
MLILHSSDLILKCPGLPNNRYGVCQTDRVELKAVISPVQCSSQKYLSRRSAFVRGKPCIGPTDRNHDWQLCRECTKLHEQNKLHFYILYMP